MRVAGHQPLVGVLHAAGRARGELGLDAADGRIVAAVPVLRQPADGTPPGTRGRVGGAAPGRRLMRLMGLEAVYRKPRTSAAQPGHRIYPVSASRGDDRPPGPSLVRRHHLHPGDGGLPVPGRGHGLGQPSRAGLAAVEHDGHRLLHRCAGSGASDGHAGDLQHGSRGAVYEHDVHRAGTGRARNARWTAAGGAWTTSSSSGCGGR